MTATVKEHDLNQVKNLRVLSWESHIKKALQAKLKFLFTPSLYKAVVEVKADGLLEVFLQ